MIKYQNINNIIIYFNNLKNKKINNLKAEIFYIINFNINNLKSFLWNLESNIKIFNIKLFTIKKAFKITFEKIIRFIKNIWIFLDS